ncbi:glycerol kinase [Halteromyces radiatus]|uniref:glycerol kinase n=1 Tax=Halteromyces radiatus TaxID=101107 RepID=UPI00221EAD89|nr:glycerol kinase [Halteromyces radiatus]KAI8093665.1 glycerol kinase [Halteromyces radiatus]
MPNNTYIGAIDQGTSTTRFLIFNDKGRLITFHQLEFEQICPKPGWIEHDPYDLLDSTIRCADEAFRKFGMMGRTLSHVKAIGVTNQRETTIVWDRLTGEPLHNAIVWSDARTDRLVEKMKKKQKQMGIDIEGLCGLSIHNYFSAVKLQWLMQNVSKVKKAIDNQRALFGTVDSWLIWNLTGGIQGGLHITDVTNASRTMFMNLKTCEWDEQLLEFFGVPAHVLPKIVSSSDIYGEAKWGPLEGMPIAGCLGDQQAAFVGQQCFKQGEAKNTYGTGAFMVLNVGTTPVPARNGLLSTVGYKFGKCETVYALEGSIAVAGAAVNWMKNNLGMISHPSEINELAKQVEDTGGVVFVPAFSGLFAPYWRDDSRGTLVGMTQYTNKYHIARATLEAVCFSTYAILKAMKESSHVQLKVLKADGGMSNSDVCMQMQADILGLPVERPKMKETTALGAAFAAGCAVGIWNGTEDLAQVKNEGLDVDVFEPKFTTQERHYRLKLWEAALERSYGWTTVVGAANGDS